jgi:hypothetical protein
MIDQILEAEIGYIFTQDEDYLEIHGSILPPKDPKNPDQRMSDAFVQEIKERVVEYFFLVFRNLRDTVPKIIGNVLINNSANQMQVELYDAISRDQQTICETLSDPEFVIQQRNDLRNSIRILKSCLKKLQEEDLLMD